MIRTLLKEVMKQQLTREISVAEQEKIEEAIDTSSDETILALLAAFSRVIKKDVDLAIVDGQAVRI